MSNPVNITQAVYAAFGRGDIPVILELLDADVDWQFIGDKRAAYTTRLRGREQIGQWFGDVAKVDDIQAFEPREFFAGADHVTVLGWERSADRATGGIFETPWIHVFGLRGGRITRFLGIYDTEAAAQARA